MIRIVNITVEGGVIQNVECPDGVQVVVRDYDVSGSEENLKTDDNDDAYVESVWGGRDDRPRVVAIAIRDSIDEDTSARVSCLECEAVETADDLFAKLRQAVGEWLSTTASGKLAWAESEGDFNIGDLSLRDEEPELQPILEKHGIQELSIDICIQESRNQFFRWAYDAHLFSEEVEAQMQELEGNNAQEGN